MLKILRPLNWGLNSFRYKTGFQNCILKGNQTELRP